jgi:hypothetical protein
MGSEMQPRVMRAQKRNLLVIKLVIKFYVQLKKVYFMGSEVQSKATNAQKRNLLVMKFL